MKDSNKPQSQEQGFDQWAEQILADETFLDRLYEKMRAREIVRSEKSTTALAQAAMEGARIAQERLYGPDVSA